MAAELGNDIVSGVVLEVAESLFDTIKWEISYVFKYKSYMHNLENQVKELEYRRQMVEQPVNHARRQGDVIYKGVEDWLISVDEFNQLVVRPIKEDEDEAKKYCFKGMCPNLFKRYNLSKKAIKAAKDGAILLGKGNFSDVSYRSVPERTPILHVRGFENFDSRMSIFQDIMEALKDDEVKTIGVYGMGGVGKTTLVKEVARQVMEDKLFDEVVVAEVSLNPDLSTIQEKIASVLGLEFGQDETVFQRATRLRLRLNKEKRILVILDNIWAKLDLEAVGIPYGGDDQRQCTILLTSRSQHVLCNVFNSQKNFCIEVLSDAEAMSLFWNAMGHYSTDLSDFQLLAVEIVRKCGGLPIAIKTIANALKNKSLPVWKDALNQLRNSNPREIPGMDADVYSSIELSYNFLQSKEAKSLFQLCALQIDGSRISIDDLMRYGMGLGLFTNVNTLEAARNRVHKLIDDLKTSCLLLDGDNEHIVKMHDIIYVVAVSIATDELMLNIPNVADLKGELENGMGKDATAISLPYRDIEELPERVECPKLKLFMLFEKYDSSLQVPNPFFEGMKQLRVLHLTRIHFPLIPSSLDCLINLRTLSLISCHSLGDVGIVGELKKLEILSFRGSDVEQLPGEIGRLTWLRLLDLSNCRRLKVIAPNVISNLSRLEELYMGNSFNRWEKVEGRSNASLIELKELSKLTTLEIHIRDAKIMPQSLVSVELERFRIFVGDAWNWFGKYKTSRTLKFSGINKNIYLGNEMKMLLSKCEDLYLDKLDGFKNFHELDDEEGFPRLKHLHIQNDCKILYIANSMGRAHCNSFYLLEFLFLYDLINLEKVCHGQLTECQSFRKLRVINVKKCHKLKYLFSFSMAKNLLQLEEIQVTECKNLKMIVGEESENCIFYENEIINFTQLHSLTLRDLPQLISSGFNLEVSQTFSGISSTSKEIVAKDNPEDFMTVLFNNKVTTPNLKKLELSSLNCEKIWLDQFSTMSNCQKLTKLTVHNCNRLKYLFPYSVVSSLVLLQKLEIQKCESLEGVINTSMLGRDEKEVIGLMGFPKLDYLELSGLPRLTNFIPISSLEENYVLHTDTDMQPLFDEKVGLPSLEVLKIERVNNLRTMWHHQLALDSFSILKELYISWCDKLMNIFSSNVIMGRRFDRLERLSVTGCGSIGEIIEETSSDCNNCMVNKEFSMARRFDVFPRLISLELRYLPELRSIYHGIHIFEWPALKHLRAVGLLKVEILFASSELLSQETKNQQPLFLVDHHKVRFLSLESLRINKMDNLRKIFHHQLASDSFNKLKELRVIDCDGLINIFPASIVTERRFERLENLVVVNCGSIEEIIEQSSSNCMVVPTTSSFDVFPRLGSLELWLLPKLISVYQGKHILEWPVLEHLKIVECNKVEMLFASSKSLNQETGIHQPLFLVEQHKVAFPCLTILEVSYCDGLRNLATLSTVENLLKLRRMKIYSMIITNIIELQVREAVDSIIFSHLEYLELDTLPRLKSFCSGNCILEFPCLEQVAVSRCPSMKIFSQGVLHTPKLHKLQAAEEKEERWEGNLNFTIQKLFE